MYDLEDTIDLNLFHSLVPSATATSVIFDKIENQNVSGYNLVGYCDANNNIAVYNNNTEYLVLNMRNAVNFAPLSCTNFFADYNLLTDSVFYNFDTRNTTSMGNMFYSCFSLRSLDLSNFKTDNVMSLGGMFNGCKALTNLDLSNFNTQNVRSMYAMFNICSRIVKIISNNFNKEALSESSLMFHGCHSLVGGNGTTYNANHINAEYARVDGENGLPGYFTAPAV